MAGRKYEVTIYDLRTLETYLGHTLKELHDPLGGSVTEAIAYVRDALAEIEAWKKYLRKNDGRPRN